jgi:hypothetical protein
LEGDGVRVDQLLMGADLAALIQTLNTATTQEKGMQELLQAAFTDSESYHNSWLASSKPKAKK